MTRKHVIIEKRSATPKDSLSILALSENGERSKSNRFVSNFDRAIGDHNSVVRHVQIAPNSDSDILRGN